MTTTKKMILTALLAICGAAHAQQEPAQRLHLDIQAQPLRTALQDLGEQAGIQILFRAEDLTREGATSPRIVGEFSAHEALQKLLARSGLKYEFVNERTVRIVSLQSSARTEASLSEVNPALRLAQASENMAPQNTSAASEIEPQEVVVTATGTRIRGAPVASPTIVRTREQVINEGKSTMAELIRDIPQNFTGGMNPGAGAGVPESKGSAFSGGYALNLRGLGADATLTLLNGRRISFTGPRQGIDISSIPFMALDRIEIIADGSSALYGSDAVAGVANVILRRDYDGVAVTGRFGASTDGGNERQQYSLVGGRTWGSGGVMVSFDYGDNKPIVASQRDYTAASPSEMTLFPFIRYRSAILSGHQSLTDNLTFQFDALYNKRNSDRVLPISVALQQVIKAPYTSRSFTLAPSLTIELPRDWSTTLSATYSEDTSDYRNDIYIAGVFMPQTEGCYCNNAKSVELTADGPLWSMPAGEVRTAVGAGYRYNFMQILRTVGGFRNIPVSQDVSYAFGEINVPVVSAASKIAWVHRLNFGAAARYEKYDAYDVVTPKVNLIYAPTPAFDIKGSWGKSFRAPTLYEQYNANFTSLVTAASRGGTGYPASATALLYTGGTPTLTAEHAKNWTATVDVHPESWGGARVELSYFNIHYQDRVVTPMLSTIAALSNPAYAQYIQRNPSLQAITSTIASGGFSNATSAPYDPANVVAIINNTSVNASEQNIHGVDANATQDFDLGGYGALALSLGGSYLDSEQTLIPLQPVEQLAGTVYNPPHLRARAGATWTHNGLSLNSLVTYIGGLDDLRLQPFAEVSSMTMLDLTARYRVASGAPVFPGIDLMLSVQNVLNEKPGFMRTTISYDTPYDSTNFSPIGRFVSFSLTKQW